MPSRKMARLVTLTVVDLPPGVERVLHGGGEVVGDLTPPWSNTTRTLLVSPAGGAALAEPVVVQWSADAATISRRLRLGRRLPEIAPRLPLAPILGGDPNAPTPFLVSRFMPGTSGRDLLGDDVAASRLGSAVGALARELRTVPTAGLRLSRRWADPMRLEAAARQWLDDGRPSLGSATSSRLGRSIERISDELGEVAPVFAHGDLAPVNVVVRDGAIVALLDLERARLAHPLYDAAWWTWIVRHHHPERTRSAGDGFLAAAGIERDRRTLDLLDLLAVLQCLEMLAGVPVRASAERHEWARRVAAALPT
ncbi:MAG: phosphotransferase family protein [Candidatus Limnocylindrales bacterium]